MKKVHMETVRARAATMAADLGIDHEVVVMDLIAAHHRNNTKVIGARISPIVTKRFKPDGSIVVTHAPSFANTVAMPALQ